MEVQNEQNMIDHLCVLRRWNSYTPRVPGSTGVGGGYFLRWNNKGIVIDPGFNFLENLDNYGYGIHDIDAIFLTHSHIDHTDSLDSLIMMFERRKRLLKNNVNPVKIFYDDGCEIKFGDYLTKLSDTFGFIERPYKYKWRDNSWQPIDELKDWGIITMPLPTYHKQIVPPGEDRGVGLKFSLFKGARCIHQIGLTSDTGFLSESGQTTYLDLNFDKLKSCDIVICHIGDIELGELLALINIVPSQKKNQDFVGILTQIAEICQEGKLWPQIEMLGLPTGKSAFVTSMMSAISAEHREYLKGKQHMGFHGVFKTFESLKDDSELKLGIISEFGEELGSFRHRIARTVSSSLKYREKQKTILTGDLGLRVVLLENAQQCIQCSATTSLLINCTICGQPVCPLCIKETCIKHKQQAIIYQCPKRECLSEEFAPPITRLKREQITGY